MKVVEMNASRLVSIVLLVLLSISAWSVRAETIASDGLYLSQEQRTLFAYALLATGASHKEKSKILSRAKDYFHKAYSQSPRDIVVESFAEYVREYRGDWPDTQSLELDLKILERRGPRAPVRITSKNPEIQSLIDAHEARQLQTVIDATFAANLSFFGRQIQAFAKSNSPQDIKTLLWSLVDEADRLMADKFDELQRVGDKMSAIAFGAVGDKAMSLALRTLFSEYYRGLKPASKKLIINAFLGGNLLADDFSKLESMIQSSGPQFQKLVQAFARQERIPPKLRTIFRRLERSVRAVPFHQVSEILSRNKEFFSLVHVEKKPLGIGTMAQTHRGVLRDADGREHDVVIRFLKPGIEERVEEDHRVLVKVAKILDALPEYKAAGGLRVSPLVIEITVTVRAELDLERTVENQEEADVYRKTVRLNTPEYKTSLQFLVPRVYRPKGNRPTELVVQEYLPGRPLEEAAAEFREAIPGLQLAAAELIAKLWVEEAFFGSGGYFHADLHPGNFSVNVVEPTITVPLMDYGMTGRLSRAEQDQVMVLSAAIEIGDAEKSATALWALIGEGRPAEGLNDVKRFARDLQLKVDSGELPILDLQQWLARASDAGLGLTATIVNLNRGAVIIDRMLEEAGSKMRVKDIGLSLARSRFFKVARLLSEKGGFSAREIVRLGLQDLRTSLMPSAQANTVHPRVALSCERIFQR